MPSRARKRIHLEARRPFDLRASADLWTAPLAVIPGLLGEIGADPVAVMGMDGLDASLLADPAQRVRCDRVALLLERCVRTTRCPHFGLLIGQRSGTAAIGLLADLIRHSETVGEALGLVSAHIRLADRGLVVLPRVHAAGRAELSLAVFDPAMRGSGPYLDAGLAISLAVMRSLCGPEWKPTSVTLTRAAPRDPRPYRLCFGAPVRFGQSRTALMFEASDLARPLEHPDPAVRLALLRRVEALEASLTVTATEDVVRVMRGLVMARTPTRAEVAAALGTSPRSLCRRLEGEGTNFRRLLTDVRCSLAAQLLEESRMPLADIAAMLHYSAPGAFTRAFKGWSGKAPARYRAVMSARRIGRAR